MATLFILAGLGLAVAIKGLGILECRMHDGTGRSLDAGNPLSYRDPLRLAIRVLRCLSFLCFVAAIALSCHTLPR